MSSRGSGQLFMNLGVRVHTVYLQKYMVRATEWGRHEGWREGGRQGPHGPGEHAFQPGLILRAGKTDAADKLSQICVFKGQLAAGKSNLESSESRGQETNRRREVTGRGSGWDDGEACACYRALRHCSNRTRQPTGFGEMIPLIPMTFHLHSVYPSFWVLSSGT